MSSHDQSEQSLLIYEVMMPYLSRESPGLMQSMTTENTRLPLFLLFIGITVFYQLYWKKGAIFNKDSGQDAAQDEQSKEKSLLSGFRDQAKKRGKLTPKMEKDIQEMEAMFDNMNSFGDKM